MIGGAITTPLVAPALTDRRRAPTEERLRLKLAELAGYTEVDGNNTAGS